MGNQSYIQLHLFYLIHFASTAQPGTDSEADMDALASLACRRIFSGYEYSMPPSWMIKLTDGWGEPKKDSEGEDDGFKIEEAGGGGGGAPLLH